MSVTNANHRLQTMVSGSWQLDPERSSVEFRTRALWGLATVKGRFTSCHGQLDLSASPAVELTIDSASLDTGNGRRDKHLRSADFFDAENHPWVRFGSDSVQVRDDTLKVSGRLSADGRSIPVELDAKAREVDGELEIEAGVTVQQRELGMTYSPLGTISPRSALSVRAHLTRAAATAA